MLYLRALLIGASACWLPSATLAQKEPKSVDCHKDLKEAVEIIDNLWSFKLFKPGTVDLEGVYRELEPEARRTRDPEGCADLLSRLLSRLQDGHSALRYMPGVEHSTPYIIVRSQRERLSQIPGRSPTVHAYVFDRDTTDEVLRTIRRGSEILTVDGVAVDSLYRFLDHRVSGSTQQWRDYLCDRRLLRGPAETQVEVTYREPGGALKTATVVRPPADTIKEELATELRVYFGDISHSHWERLEGGWGYIRYTSFVHGRLDQTIDRFDEMVDSLLEAPGLIIDLRGNGGGFSRARTEIAGRFVAEKAALTYLQVREPGQETVYELWDPTTGSFSTKVPQMVHPRNPIYTGPVVVLIDRGCFSACESLTGGLKALGRVLVIGPERSGGGSGAVGGLRLPSGAVISFSWTVGWLPDGRQIESHGVAPHIVVRERPRDWAVGRDRVLERAIKALEQGEAQPLIVRGQGD
jgi:C-terminal processing protease CtpA/Prc